jgi:hypothetical protein
MRLPTNREIREQQEELRRQRSLRGELDKDVERVKSDAGYGKDGAALSSDKGVLFDERTNSKCPATG